MTIQLRRTTPAERIAALIEATSPEDRETLTALLAENLPLYAGRNANEVSRIRGYILTAFERTGLPKSALPFVLEELQSGHKPYLVAAAAIALRGSDEPSARYASYLFRAIENIGASDEFVSFDTGSESWSRQNKTTALTEIFRSFAWLGDSAEGAIDGLEALAESRRLLFSTAVREELAAAIRAIRESEGPSCCGGEEESIQVLEEPQPAVALAHLGVTLQDQDAQKVDWGSFIVGKPSVIAFFYTRCENPNKCSLTITKLASLQMLRRQRGLDGEFKTAAITYDADYDLSARMKAYGINRGLSFGDDDRMLRATTGFAQLAKGFGLGVNFSLSIVNRHRIELYVLDSEGKVAASFLRMQWDADAVFGSLRRLLEANWL